MAAFDRNLVRSAKTLFGVGFAIAAFDGMAALELDIGVLAFALGRSFMMSATPPCLPFAYKSGNFIHNGGGPAGGSG